MASESALIAACSPRRGGNSDLAARLAAEGLGLPSRLVRVAEASVRPCLSCGVCDRAPGHCALDGPGDGAAGLFAAACSSSLTIVVSPVYFYHLPAQAKAWLDRSQRWWAARPEDRPGQGGTLAALLVAARPRGEKLFEGAERSLRYFASALGMGWGGSLCLYGLDGPDDLAADAEKQAQIRRWAASLAGGLR